MHTTSPTRILFFTFFVNAVFAALPEVDFDRMGTVGLAGAFAGLDLFQNTLPPQAFDFSTSSLLSRDSAGALTRLASTDVGGRISAGCALRETVYLAGSFSSIGGTLASNVVSYTPSSSTFAAVGKDGPNGEINAIFCDVKDNKVWVGGSFTSPGLNIAVWDPKPGIWSKPPFIGLSGAQSKVLSITTNASDSSLFFAGSFITNFQGDPSSVLNITNNPNVPFSAGATPFSSSLVPIPLQEAQVFGSPSSTDPQFDNIKAILCPLGEDGPGNSWFAADSNTAVLTIRAFKFISANGLRLGNTFHNNHGTTGFSVITIPDNKLQTLHYLDPITHQTQVCSDPCPLSTDSSLLYQDFLFDNTLTITGVQIKLSEFNGVAPGLHILQLLSSGAFASSNDSNNDASCYAPSPSNNTRTGDWVAKVANTDIAGTLQTVLVSTIAVGTPAANGSTFTWIPYVSASGNYDVNLLVPGCTNLLDCTSRTTVKITVFPGKGLQPWVSTVSQQNPTDATILVYSGPILPSSPNFVTTISMALADNPAGSGDGGFYELVADRIQLVLKSVNGLSSSDPGVGGPSGAQGINNGFGFFEWPRSLTSVADTSIDATKTLPNSTLTSLDGVGIDIFKGAGGINGLSFAGPSAITTVIHHSSGNIFLGGNFTLSSGVASGAANIVAFKGGALVQLADKGLNGPVTSFAINGDQLFVGGSFSDTVSGSTGGKLKGVAIYNIVSGAWTPLGGGVNGGVTSLGMASGQILVAGNFTRLLASASGEAETDIAGLATWDLNRSVWVNSGGFVLGSMTFVGNGTSLFQLIAGNVRASHKFGANGMVLLKNGDKNKGPQITPLSTALGFTEKDVSPAIVHRRSILNASAWIRHVQLSRLFSRQTSPTQLPPLPVPLPAPAPAILTGAFWTNSTSSKEIAIIGGNFSFDFPGSPTSRGVALYDLTSGAIQSLKGPQLNGTVRSLLVDGNQLYIGGEFTIQGASANGLAVYDLSKEEWNLDDISTLQRNTNSPIVRSITKSASKPDNIIVAGSFSQAGSLRCQSVCAYDTSSKRWNTLGNGIQGEVASITYAGTTQEILVASGSIALSDNTLSNVAQFTFVNATWSAVGTPTELPGPVSALEVNNGNASSIFAAGRSADGSSFLSFWDGKNWSILGSTLQANTTVAQLMMVPLQDVHSANAMIEPDRMLLISGSLADPSFGNASSALFDGKTFTPYIVSATAAGLPGTVSSLFRSFSSFSFSHRRFLATGVVILISIAIAAGLVFMLALIGILWTLLSRRDHKLGKLDATDDDDDDSARHRPSSLLEHINAATRTTILGSTSLHNADSEREEEKIAHDVQDPFAPDASNYLRAETPSDAVGGILAEETSRPARARYSFDGAAEGELPIVTGTEVEVLDDRDPAWWYARDVRTGQEGVVPAAYLY